MVRENERGRGNIMARKCPHCGNELIENPANENYLLCTNCDKNYKKPSGGNSGGSGSSKKSQKKGSFSILLLISFILGCLYMLYSLIYWSSATGSVSGTWEQIGAGVATALVMPHLICTAIAVIFNALGLFLNKRGFALTGAILYSVAMVLFPMYFMFVIVEMILSYIGFAKLPKQ